MDRAEESPAGVVGRLLGAINAHDLEAMVACFADDYRNEWPAHPQRSFQGVDQVRRNWSQIFAGVPDLRAVLPRMSVDGDTVWTEWDLSGTRRDGSVHSMRGVSIFGVAEGRLAWVRFYLEPVEETSGDVDTFTRQTAGSGGPAEAAAATGKRS